MRQARLTPLAIAALLAAGICGTGCGRDGGHGAPQIRTTVAHGLSLVHAPSPGDRALHLRFTAGALLWTADPVARVEVDQTPALIVVRLFINERAPAPDEHVPNYVTIQTTTVDLDRPVGQAAVMDGSVNPPAPIPVQ